ncbi:MAG: hypothetical protein ACD_23C00663G0002 [uncultured bacterium]|nr:MAG: hypothetical protein ACD_23C00663G0002 [uncultured bacterium]
MSTSGFLSITQSKVGAYPRLAQSINRLSVSLTLEPMKSATAAGMNVTDRIMAPSSAMTTVKAMGWNILPSTPVSAKMGR